MDVETSVNNVSSDNSGGGSEEGATSSLEHFFREEVTFILFCGQVLLLVVLAWSAGVLGFSVAWSLVLAYWLAKYWSRIVDVHVWELVTRSLAKKVEQSKNPANESVEWANVIVDRWLRFSEPHLAEMVRSNINPILASCKPSFLDSLEVGSFSLGSALPRISSLSVCDSIGTTPPTTTTPPSLALLEAALFK